LKALDAEPHFVICLRHPVAVARSQTKKYGVPFATSLGVWLWTTLESLYRSRDYPTAVIPFPEVVSNPRGYLQNIVNLVPSWKPSEESWTGLNDLFKAGLIKNDEMGSSERVAPLILQTYQLAIQCAQESEKFSQGGFDQEITELYQQMRDWQKMFHHEPLIADEVRAYYQEGRETKTSSFPYKPSRNWQTASLEITASRGVPIPVYFYCLPVYIWIKKATWVFDGKREFAVVQTGQFGTVNQAEGLAHISALPGGPQCVVQAPSKAGEATLEIEFMVEHNPMYEAEACMHLGQSVETLQQQLASMAPQQRPLYSSFKTGRKR
ncbi:MAG: hypothetical protein ABUL72_06605, partial [Armatimonadota bacterium]